MEPFHNAVDVLVETLKRSGRESYLHSMVCLGEHRGQRHAVAEQIELAVEKQMEAYHDEGLTGMLLVYTNKFVNLIEGSQRTIMGHLEYMVDMLYDPDKHIGPSVDIFVEVCHIKRRIFSAYHVVFGNPPSAGAKFTMSPSVEDLARHFNLFNDKYFKIVDFVRKNPDQIKNLDNTKSKAAMMLPEPELINFMLRSRELMSIEDVLIGSKCPPFFKTYDDVIWPLPGTNMPYHGFFTDHPAAVDEKTSAQAMAVVSAHQVESHVASQENTEEHPTTAS